MRIVADMHAQGSSKGQVVHIFVYATKEFQKIMYHPNYLSWLPIAVMYEM